MTNPLAKYLKDLRKDFNLTCEEIAKISNNTISASYLRDLESGRRYNPSDYYLQIIAELYYEYDDLSWSSEYILFNGLKTLRNQTVQLRKKGGSAIKEFTTTSGEMKDLSNTIEDHITNLSEDDYFNQCCSCEFSDYIEGSDEEELGCRHSLAIKELMEINKPLVIQHFVDDRLVPCTLVRTSHNCKFFERCPGSGVC